MVYDHWRQRVMLFGGQDAFQNRTSDTWEPQSQVVVRPVGRRNHSMAYDLVRQRVVTARRSMPSSPILGAARSDWRSPRGVGWSSGIEPPRGLSPRPQFTWLAA
jgi:hypothetical protein